MIFLMKKIYIRWILLGVSLLLPYAIAAEIGQTTFHVGPEILNNDQIVQLLEIPGAGELDVTVQGDLNQKNEILRIYDLEGKELQRFSGATNNHDLDQFPPFTVSGDGIKVTLNTKKDTRRIKGITVSIRISSPLTEFTQIKKSISELVEKVSTNGATEAYPQITKSLELVENLSKQFSEQSDEKQKISLLIECLLSISQTYTMVSGIRTQLAEKNQAYFEKLQENIKKTHVNKEKNQHRIDITNKKIEQLKNQLSYVTQKIERIKLEVSMKGEEQVLRSIKSQLETWDTFVTIQEGLLEKLKTHQQNLDLLLHILQVNAKVYRESAYMLQLRQNLPDAEEMLTDLSDVLGVLKNLEANWREVNGFTSKIQSQNFIDY